jgi:hypothetical protein
VAFPEDRLDVEVSLAFGADLTADPSTWSWTDITEYVRYAPGIEVTVGRRDETSQSQPSQCTLTLDNASGRFTPRNPSSPYYPNVRFNCPLRVRVDPGSGFTTRFVGFVDEWPVRWDRSGNDTTVQVTASGVLRRLVQARDNRSAMFREIMLAEPDAYWPLEAGPAAVQGASATGGPPLTGTLTFGETAGPPGSGPVLDITNRGTFQAQAQAVVGFESTWRMEFVAQLPSTDAATSGGAYMIEWSAPGLSGDVTYWRWVASTNAELIVQHYLYGTVVANELILDFDPFDGEWHHYRIDGLVSGGSTTIDYYVDGAFLDFDTLAYEAFGPGMVRIATAITTTDECLTSLGHIAVWYSHPAADTYDAMLGWAGETTADRLTRICSEAGIYYDGTHATGTDAMGPQPTGSVLDVLQDCEQADAGLLYDTGGGIAYRSRSARYNQTVALALDYAAGDLQHPLEANDDDQQLKNDVTATRPGGSPYSFTDTDGPLGTDAVGWYSDSVNTNVELDSQAEQRAAWQVGLGTVDELRYPQVGLNFARSPELIPTWLATTIGERVTIANPPSELPPGDPDLQMVGYEEYITPFVWSATLNTVPNRPYLVIELDEGDNESRLDAEGSGMWLDATSVATSLQVYNVDETIDEVWSTAAGDVPFDVEIGGEQVTVTAVANNAITFVAAGTVAHGNNASVAPGIPAGIQNGDLLLLFAAIRGTSATVSDVSGWSEAWLSHGHVKVFAKKTTGTESSPTVSFTGGAAGDDTSAQICAFRNATKLLQVAHQTNGSAQNIAYPLIDTDRDGTVIVWVGWKQDDWTSVTGPGTEIGEPDTTTGNDQGIVWAYQIQTDATNVAAGSFTVTGGGAAVSKSGWLQLDGSVQTFTATRSVNGVSKAQTQDTAVALSRPHVLAL